MTKWIQENPVWATAILALLAIVAMGIWIRIDPEYDTLKFVPVTYDAVVNLLTPIFLVALFLERALEVFVSTGRKLAGADKDRALQRATDKIKQLKERVKLLQDQLDALGAASMTQAQHDEIRQRIGQIVNLLPDKERDQRNAQATWNKYKAETQRVVFFIGALFGLIIALAGVRVVAPLVDFQLANWGDFQNGMFHSLDVILTAGLLAGGSSGIHQIVKVFGDFTTQARR